VGLLADLRGDLVAVAGQEALVATVVADDLDVGCDLRVALNEAANGGAKAMWQELLAVRIATFLGRAVELM